jgi:hypothetical protein
MVFNETRGRRHEKNEADDSSAFDNLAPDAALRQRQAVGTTIAGTIGLVRFALFQWPPA